MRSELTILDTIDFTVASFLMFRCVTGLFEHANVQVME